MTLLQRISIAFTLLMMSVAALAQGDLASAKAQGVVGERPDGLVAVVSNSTPQLEALVAQVNEERMAEYRQIAAETEAPLEAVQARAGRQIIERLPAGQYFMDAAGGGGQKSRRPCATSFVRVSCTAALRVIGGCRRRRARAARYSLVW